MPLTHLPSDRPGAYSTRRGWWVESRHLATAAPRALGPPVETRVHLAMTRLRRLRRANALETRALVGPSIVPEEVPLRKRAGRLHVAVTPEHSVRAVGGAPDAAERSANVMQSSPVTIVASEEFARRDGALGTRQDCPGASHRHTCVSRSPRGRSHRRRMRQNAPIASAAFARPVAELRESPPRSPSDRRRSFRRPR